MGFAHWAARFLYSLDEDCAVSRLVCHSNIPVTPSLIGLVQLRSRTGSRVVAFHPKRRQRGREEPESPDSKDVDNWDGDKMTLPEDNYVKGPHENPTARLLGHDHAVTTGMYFEDPERHPGIHRQVVRGKILGSASK